MPLFTGFKTSASITRNKFDILAAEANKELIENNLSLNVTNYYFQILLNKEIYRIAQEQNPVDKRTRNQNTDFDREWKSSAVSII